MYESAVQNGWNMDEWWKCKQCPKDAKRVSNPQYVVIAQMEAVLWVLAQLSLLVQSDVAGSLSYSFIHIFRAFVFYFCNDSWWVADVDLDGNTGGAQNWHGNAKIPQRNLWEPPVQSADRKVSHVFLKEKKTNKLEEVPQENIKRVMKEFPKYLVPADDDQMLAMACNPFTANEGMY